MRNILLLITMLSAALICNGQRYFMKVEGPAVNGISGSLLHPDEFEMKSFSFTISQSGNVQSESGTGPGKSSIAPIQIKLLLSSGIAEFYKAIHDRTKFEKVTISIVKDFNDGLNDYLVYTLEEVHCTAMSNRSSVGEEILTVTLSLMSDKFRVEFYKALSNGNRDITTVKKFGWDITRNRAL